VLARAAIFGVGLKTDSMRSPTDHQRILPMAGKKIARHAAITHMAVLARTTERFRVPMSLFCSPTSRSSAQTFVSTFARSRMTNGCRKEGVSPQAENRWGVPVAAFLVDLKRRLASHPAEPLALQPEALLPLVGGKPFPDILRVPASVIGNAQNDGTAGLSVKSTLAGLTSDRRKLGRY